MKRENTMEELANLIDDLEIEGNLSYFIFYFFLEASDPVALYFFLNGYIEEIIEENPEMETIVNERGGLPVTMDDWFDWLRDEVVGIGMTAEEEEVIRSNFELISFLVYFFIFFWFFCLISSFFSSLF
jgi:hypothetical protein